MGHIFISYSRKDISYAEKLVHALRHEGFNPWVDSDDLGAGTLWHNRLQKQIGACDAYILIMSRNSKVSKWVPDELITAKTKDKPIFPLLLDNTELFLAIQTIQLEDVRGGKLPSEKFYERLAQVAKRDKRTAPRDTNHVANAARQKKVNASATRITNSLSKAGSNIADFFAVSLKVTDNLATAITKSKLVKKVNTQIQKNVKKTSKLFR